MIEAIAKLDAVSTLVNEGVLSKKSPFEIPEVGNKRIVGLPVGIVEFEGQANGKPAIATTVTGGSVQLSSLGP